MLTSKIHKLQLTGTFFTSLIQADNAWCWRASCYLSQLLRKDREPRWYLRTHTHTHTQYKQELWFEALGKLANACSPFQNIIKRTRLEQAQVLRTLSPDEAVQCILCVYLYSEKYLYLRNRFCVNEWYILLEPGRYSESAFWVIDTN